MQKIPRPEYPRPQFVRDEWINLNGEWEFAFDDSNKGVEAGWHEGATLSDRILVPFPYQSALSGINDKGVHEVVWYARDLEIAELGEKDLLLHFGAVDYRSTVWVNGHEVGHNRGGHVPFWFDIAPYLKVGKNRVVLRVEDTQDPNQPRGKQSTTGLPHGIDYYCTTGIWQTVWLEPVSPIRIQEIDITPLLEESALELSIYLHAPSTGWDISIEVLDDGKVISKADVKTPYATLRTRVKVPNAKLWTPDTPHLYGLRITLLKNGREIDRVDSYAGMRSVTINDSRILLNGKPLFLAMVLDQGYWPESYMAAPSDDALRMDVEWTKRFGFNGARKHQKIEDPRWLYWCDRLGLLAWGEMPNARAWSPEAEELLLAEWERAVRRDINHPSVITWVPANESMGFPGLEQDHPGQYAFLERVVRLTRRLDPTRPVIDNDGWEHTDITDICAIHDYTPTAEALLKRYKEKLSGGDLPATVWYKDKPLFVLGSKYRGQPVLLTEVGGFLMDPGLPKEKRDKLYNFYDSFTTHEELFEKYRDLMDGLSQLKFLSGFCYTQLTDIEQEINGLLTYDRKPKIDPERIAAIHRERFGELSTQKMSS
jgi:beta-galactosidase/beta-glucuronidase